MNARSFEVLTGRVDRLERECRAWRRGAAVVAIALVALASAGAGDDPRPIEELNIKRIVVRGDDGREAIILGTQDGGPLLSVLADGQERLSIAAPGGSPSISFVDAGKPRLAFGLSPSGAPVLNFNDADQRRRISLGIFPKVGPMISVLDEANKPTFRTP